MNRLFAIGDIHGCSKTFRKLLMDGIGIHKEDEVCCIGDYIDRGPDSRGVIDLILDFRSDGYKIHTIRGNHEQMILNTLSDRSHMDNWIKNGAIATLNSFGIHSLNELVPIYIDFFNQTAYFLETPQYVFVHAGLNFNYPDPLYDKEAMLWTRDETVDRDKLNGKIIIHGHTPKPHDFIINQLNHPEIASINIDGGCVYKNRPDMGNLFAINLTDKEFISVRNID